MKVKQKTIKYNEQGRCPVCGLCSSSYYITAERNMKSQTMEYIETVEADECGFYKAWKCHKCKCTGREYYEFTDHYDVYAADGEARIDSENRVYPFPYLCKDRLRTLLKKAISALHETTGGDKSYENLHDLADDLDIIEEEYALIMNN